MDTLFTCIFGLLLFMFVLGGLYQLGEDIKMGFLKDWFCGQPGDKIDRALGIAAGFDYLTPASDLIAGYNTIETTGSNSACEREARNLKASGISCRVDYHDGEWRVISER